MGFKNTQTAVIKCDICGHEETVIDKMTIWHNNPQVVDPVDYGWTYVDEKLCCPKHRANIELLVNVLLAAGRDDIEKPDVPERKIAFKQVRIF